MWMKTLLVFLMSVLMILSLAPVQAKSVYKELQCEELNQATRVNGYTFVYKQAKDGNFTLNVTKGKKRYVYKKAGNCFTNGKMLYLPQNGKFLKVIKLTNNKTVACFKESHVGAEMTIITVNDRYATFAGNGEAYGKSSYLYKMDNTSHKVKLMRKGYSDFIRDTKYIFYKKAMHSYKRSNLDGSHEKSVSEKTWGYAVGAVG